MKWVRRWTKARLPLAWKYTAHGQIWRFMPSASGAIILEERDIEHKEVRFSALEAESGKRLWMTEQFRNRWWMTIETLHNDVLFLHEYATPDMPDHKSVIALNGGEGTLMWSNEEMKFLFAHERSVYAAKDVYDRRVFYELDIATGGILREVDDGYIDVVRSDAATEDSSALRFARPAVSAASAGQDSPGGLREWLAGRSALEEYEYIDIQTGWIVGWYERLAPADPASRLRHRISIVRMADCLLRYEDEIDSNVKVRIPDLFVCRRDMLYYIKEKRAVCAVNLPQP